MRCRNIVDGNVVWFGSVGKTADGKAIKQNTFAENADSVRAGLTQQLSVLKYELWYRYNYGLPLVDKIKNKTEIDTYVASVISDYPEVQKIIKFESALNNAHYECSFLVLTKYGEISYDLII